MRVAVVALTLVLVGGCQSDDRHSDSEASSPRPTATASMAADRTYASNRAGSVAEQARLVEEIQLPDGAAELPDEPAGWEGGYLSSGPSDPKLTTTQWWSAPGSVDDVVAFLDDHVPNDLLLQDGQGGGPARSIDLFYREPTSPDPTGFLPIQISVTVGDLDGQTVVRVNGYGAARLVTTDDLRITGDVTSVDVVRVAADAKPSQHVRETLQGDDAARLAEAINALQPSIWPPFVASCPFPGNPPPSDTLTFHADDGDVVVSLTPSCWGQVHVSHEGREPQVDIAGQQGDATLEPGNLTQVLDAVLGS